MKKHYLLLLFITLFASASSYAQKHSIKDIVNPSNSSLYKNSSVTIEGIVTQYTPRDNNSTAYYLLRGDYGNIIKVNTNKQPPIIEERYQVSGTVVFNANNMPYLIETSSKIIMNNNQLTHLFLIGGIALLVIIGLVLYIRMQKKEGKSNSEPVPAPAQQYTKPTANIVEPPVVESSFKTIKVNLNNAPKTMKLMPGLLEISNGPDKGKRFYITGSPTPHGNVVTIGREEVSGDKRYSHIQLVDSSVSRKQAELVSVGGKTFLKNLSEVNHTLLDGAKLETGEMKEIEVGSIIKAGATEFTYKLN